MQWAPTAWEHAGRSTIVIPVYNQLHYTEACIASLQECTMAPYDLIAVDNGSTDGTPAYLAAMAKGGLPLQVIRNEQNLGFTLAANQGMRGATGDYVVLLNNDTTVTPNWLFGLRRVAESADEIGIVGPKILHPQTDRIRTIGGLVFRKSGVGAPPGENADRHDPAYQCPFECQYAEGSCMFVKRSVIDAIGYLDETYAPAYYEDTDYCFRAREAGYRVVYSPYSEIYHHSTVTAQAVQKEDDRLSAAARRNDRVFRQRWSHRFW